MGSSLLTNPVGRFPSESSGRQSWNFTESSAFIRSVLLRRHRERLPGHRQPALCHRPRPARPALAHRPTTARTPPRATYPYTGATPSASLPLCPLRRYLHFPPLSASACCGRPAARRAGGVRGVRSPLYGCACLPCCVSSVCDARSCVVLLRDMCLCLLYCC